MCKLQPSVPHPLAAIISLPLVSTDCEFIESKWSIIEINWRMYIRTDVNHSALMIPHGYRNDFIDIDSIGNWRGNFSRRGWRRKNSYEKCHASSFMSEPTHYYVERYPGPGGGRQQPLLCSLNVSSLPTSGYSFDGILVHGCLRTQSWLLIDFALGFYEDTCLQRPGMSKEQGLVWWEKNRLGYPWLIKSSLDAHSSLPWVLC